ncbi:MAG: hypothetical protein E7080_01725 [Bacteroidales bacterium]|nr:hypothetical protein [Bacteroidales bacterium]
MLKKRFGILLLLCIVGAAMAVAQGVTWSVDLNTIFDNREGDDYYSSDGTIFLTRVSPEVGLAFQDKHKIAAGVSWIQPCGDDWKNHKVLPTVYYRYDSGEWRASFGIFPRSQFVNPLPTFLLSDSIAYNEPNVRGLLIQYVKPRGYAELSLDWRSQQSETRREAFNINFNGEWNPRGALLVGGYAQVNHLAKRKNAPEGEGVNDDIMANPYVGLNLSRCTALDSLQVKAGALVSLQRSRAAGGWQNRAGLLVNAVAEKKRISVEETFFVGKGVMPLYPYFGTLLNMGDPYFQAPMYSRTDVNFHFIRNRFVNLEASLVFHYTKEAFGFWQQLKLRVFVDEKLWKTRDDKTTHAEWLRNNY